MSKNPKSAPAPEAATGIATISDRPSYLAEVDSTQSLDMLKQYVVPPRLKIVQKAAKKPLCDLFNTGDVVIMPLMEPIMRLPNKGAEIGHPFHIVPLFFFPEWISTNPIELGGNMIRERSIDPKSVLAAKCKNPDTRRERHPEVPQKDGKDMFIRNTECLNFVCVIVPPNPFEMLPLTITFSRGSYRSGGIWSTLIMQRKAPIYAGVYEARSRFVPNEKGDYYRLEVSNPTVDGIDPWVRDRSMYDDFAAMSKEYLDVYQAGLLQVDHDEEEAAAEQFANANAASETAF